MAQIIGIASLGALLALAAMAWEHAQPPTGAGPVGLSISDIGAKVDAKSLPEQHIEDRTLIFVGP